MPEVHETTREPAPRGPRCIHSPGVAPRSARVACEATRDAHAAAVGVRIDAPTGARVGDDRHTCPTSRRARGLRRGLRRDAARDADAPTTVATRVDGTRTRPRSDGRARAPEGRARQLRVRNAARRAHLPAAAVGDGRVDRAVRASSRHDGRARPSLRGAGGQGRVGCRGCVGRRIGGRVRRRGVAVARRAGQDGEGGSYEKEGEEGLHTRVTRPPRCRPTEE